MIRCRIRLPRCDPLSVSVGRCLAASRNSRCCLGLKVASAFSGAWFSAFPFLRLDGNVFKDEQRISTTSRFRKGQHMGKSAKHWYRLFLDEPSIFRDPHDLILFVAQVDEESICSLQESKSEDNL